MSKNPLAARFQLELNRAWPGNEKRTAVVACSGGPDSTALALLAATSLSVSLENITVAHFNHLLRGSESDGDEQFVRELAEELDCTYRTDCWSAAALAKEHPGTNLQAAARNARYRFLTKVAAESDCPVILTAHHSRDRAETILHHLVRGGGTGAWSSLKACLELEPNLFVVRPLLSFHPKELQQLLKDCAVASREDRSNTSRSYKRNWWRHEILAQWPGGEPLAEFSNESERNTLIEHEALELANGLVASALKRPRLWKMCGRNLPTSRDNQLLFLLLRELLTRFLETATGTSWYPVRRRPMEALLALLHNEASGTVTFPRGLTVRYADGVLTLSCPPDVAEMESTP